MTTDSEVAIATDNENGHKRQLALLKAVGLDRLSPEQRTLAIEIARKYELDLLLRHAIIIEGRLYITRDGLLHIAHRSGQLDGIATTRPVIEGEFWNVDCTVYRKDMTRGFTYFGRYPTKGGNQKFAPEMATKVAEVMSLRRAFDVSAPTAEERWDTEVAAPEPPAAPTTLAERVAVQRAAVTAPAAVDPVATAPDPTAVETCGDEDASPMGLGYCSQSKGHKGAHKSDAGTWP